MNIPQTALTFTSNTIALIEMLKDIRNYVSIPNLKSRIYRIIKRLENTDNDDYVTDELSSTDET